MTRAPKSDAKKRIAHKTAKKRPRGRPTRFKAEHCGQALKLCRLGATDKDLADFFGVDVATVNRWKMKHPDFCESLKAGKTVSDAEVANMLFKRALGYSHPEDKIMQYEGSPVIVPTIKHYPPDTIAAIFWLKNRRPDLWRDKVTQEISGPDGGPIQTEGDFRPSAEDEAVIRRIAETRANLQTTAPE